MLDIHIANMAKSLVSRGIISDEELPYTQITLKEYWEDKIAVSWSIEDVKTRAEDIGDIELTDQQAASILKDVFHDYDSSYGITETNFDDYIVPYKKEN